LLPTGSLAEQIPDEEVQIQEIPDSCALIEELFDKAVQDLGVEDAASQALQQAHGAVGQLAGQAQEAASAVTG
jgi:hypothetical protein